MNLERNVLSKERLFMPIIILNGVFACICDGTMEEYLYLYIYRYRDIDTYTYIDSVATFSCENFILKDKIKKNFYKLQTHLCQMYIYIFLILTII